MSGLEELRALIEARTNQKAIKAGDGYLFSFRPHRDSTPSVKLSPGRDGRTLLFDHGGRERQEVLEEWGLTDSDLFTEETRTAPASAGPPVVIRQHLYQNGDRSENRTIDRLEPKSFRQSWPGPNGTRVYKKPDGAKDVLYRLPELLAADPAEPVLYVEGEKDADTLAALGFTVTTNFQGAGKVTREAAEALQGRHVVLLLDNDSAGEEHGRKTHEVLTQIGAASVKVVRFSELEAKGDVSDWLALGHGREALLQRIQSAEPYAGPEDKPTGAMGRLALTGRLDLTRMDEVTHRPVLWLWDGWLPLWKVGLLAGAAGDGKSSIAADLTARYTRGDQLPDGSMAEAIVVLWFLGEDTVEDVFWERLTLFGADLSKVFAATSYVPEDGKATPLDLSKHEAVIRQAIEETGAKLLILDPVTSFTGSADLNAAVEVRQYLTVLQRLAEDLEVTVLGVVHTAKPQAGTSRRAFQQVAGSFAWGAVARVVLVNGPHPDQDAHPGKRVLAVAKSNLGPIPPALLWSREKDGPVVWHGATELTAESVFGDQPVSPREEAEEFLRDVLRGGAQLASHVTKEAKEAGISERTLRRARENLGVEAEREGGKATGKVWWRLPAGQPLGQGHVGGGQEAEASEDSPPLGQPPSTSGPEAGPEAEPEGPAAAGSESVVMEF